MNEAMRQLPVRQWDPPGYSVVLVPVPALEPAVLPALRTWAPDYLMRDGSVNAHITVLGPFLTDPLPAVPLLRSLLSGVPPFEVTLRRLGRFPDSGLVYVAPEPADPWRDLTRRLVAQWPECPPYGGSFGAVVPHLSIDHAPDVASVTPLVEPLLPVTLTVSEVVIAWYEPRASRHLARIPLGNIEGRSASEAEEHP